MKKTIKNKSLKNKKNVLKITDIAELDFVIPWSLTQQLFVGHLTIHITLSQH